MGLRTRLVDLGSPRTDLGIPTFVCLTRDMLALDADRDRRGCTRREIGGVCTQREGDLEPRLSASDADLKAHLARWVCERGHYTILIVSIGEGAEEGGPYGKIFWGQYKSEVFAWEEGALYEVEFLELVGELGLPGEHVEVRDGARAECCSDQTLATWISECVLSRFI